MPDNYSVKAILSAEDKGFSSTFGKASGVLDSLESKVKSGLGFGILTGIGQQAFSAISSGVTGLVSEMNSSSAAWQTFNSNMKIFGKSESEINSVKSELQDFATKTIYSASDMASTYSQLAAVGTKNTDKLVKGFGGLAAAAENPQQAMKTLSQQATQMAAKPTVQWMDFKLMLEQTPAGIAAVAKQMGKSTSELVTDVQDGKVSTQDFFDAISAVGTNKSFTKLATQYKTAGQAMDGLKETLSNKLMPAFDAVSSKAIDGISKLIDNLGTIDAEGITKDITGAIDTVGPYFSAFADAAGTAAGAVGDAFGAIGSAIGDMLKDKDTLKTFKGVVKGVGDAIAYVAGIVKDHAKEIAQATPYIIGLAAGFKMFKAVKSVVPGVQGFTKAIGNLAGKALNKTAEQLTETAVSETVAGEASKTSAKDVLAAAAAFVALGVGVALISVGFALIAQSAIALANAGAPAIVIMVAMAAAIVGLAVGASILGPALTAGSIGFIAFGAAIALVGVGALLAAAALALIALVLPTLVEYGVQGATSILALSGAMVAFGAGALVAGAGCIVLGAGLIIVGAGALVAAAGVMALGVATLILGVAVLITAVGVMLLGSALPAVASGSLAAAGGMTAFGAATLLAMVGCLGLGVGLLLLAVGCIAAAAGLLAGTAVMIAFGAGVVVASAGTLILAAALLTVKGTMKSIATSAEESCSSLKSMKNSISFVNSALESLGSLAKSALNSLFSAFDNAESKAESSGQAIGNNIKSGIRSGLEALPVIANASMIGFNATLITARAAIQASGAYIAQGLAVGMSSQLAYVRSVASQLADAADQAIQAKAKIGSPSKVQIINGEFWGQGFAIGISNKAKAVKNAAVKLLSIPSLSTPDMAFSMSSGSLDDEYTYNQQAEYTINVPLSVDGREFAKATSEYTQEELNQKEKFNNKLKGVK